MIDVECSCRSFFLSFSRSEIILFFLSCNQLRISELQNQRSSLVNELFLVRLNNGDDKFSHAGALDRLHVSGREAISQF